MSRYLQWVVGQLWGVALLWLLAFALCLSGWALLSGSQDGRQTQRITLAAEVASAELGGDLRRSRSPQLGPQVRALLVRRDIGFAWLRVRDAEGHAVASAGRLESGMAARLPGGLRRQLYGLISSEHRVPLLYGGEEAGALEFGLLTIGGAAGSSGGRILLGLALLGLGLPALLLLSVRLRQVFAAEWSTGGGTVAARVATAAVLDTTRRPRPSTSMPVAMSIPSTAGELLKVFDRGALVVDRHQAVTDINDLAAELTGWTRNEACGQPLSDILSLYHADTQQPVRLSLEDCFSGIRERMQGHYALRSRNGTLCEIDIDAGPLRDPTGYIAGVLLCINKSSQAGGLLQRIVPGQTATSPHARQQLSQVLLDQVLDCLVTTDSQDRIQFLNGHALEAFGYTLMELRGEHISRLIPVPFLRRTQLRVADFSLAFPDAREAKATVQRRDGSQVDATLVVHPVDIRGRQGHVITVRPAQVRPTEAGVALNPRLRHLLGSLTDEACVADPDSLHLLAANPTALENLGLSADQLCEMTLLRLCPRLPPETLRDHIARLREGTADIVEFRAWYQRADGSGYEVNSRLSLWSGEGAAVLLLVAKPVDTRIAPPDTKLREDRVEYLASRDALTGLPGQPLFMQRLQLAISAQAGDPHPFVLVQLALSDFDAFIEVHGHEAGDRLLKAVADRLSVAVRSSDTVARLGTDEFLLLMGGIRIREDASGLLRRVQQALSPPVRIGQHEFTVAACLGATVYPDDARSTDALLLNAGAALDAARVFGPGHAQLYRPSDASGHAVSSDPAALLRQAQLRGDLVLELQPLHDVRIRRIIGAEVLMAWQYPGHGLLRTADQLRQAGGEEALVRALGPWILEQACEQQANWRNLELHALPLLINLSALPLADRRAAQALRGVLAHQRVPAEQLIAMVNAADLDPLQDKGSWLSVLRDLGLRIGVNDVDPARLELLRQADVDVLRLTPRTLAGLPGSRDAADQTTAIIQVAQRLGVRIFASGVERVEQREALMMLGCHVQQGRLLGGPLDPRVFARMLVRADSGVF